MKLYVKAFRDGWYFGKEEAELFGDLITDLCSGWVISKRAYHCDNGEEFSLSGVADLLQSNYPDRCVPYTLHFGSETQDMDFDMFSILGALEGMCHNNKACEVADGFYYVGSYQDWKNDIEAQNNLNELLAAESEL